MNGIPNLVTLDPIGCALWVHGGPRTGPMKLPNANGPVLPSQPIAALWEIGGGAETLSAMGNVIATISYNNNVLYTSKPVKPKGNSKIAQYLLGGEGWITVPNLPQQLAQQLYT